MTPTLAGRIQARLALALLPGVPLTLLLAALLDGITVTGGLTALAGITVLGLGWELLYQRLQQRRWDRDWPTPFVLGSGLPEGVASWCALGLAGLAPASPGSFAVLFGTLWLTGFLVLQGPMRVLAPHWRFQGMRVVPQPLVTQPPEVDVAERLRLQLPALPLQLRPTTLQRGLGVAALTVMVVAAIAIGEPDPGPETAQGDVPALVEDTDRRSGGSTEGRRVSRATWDTTARVAPARLVIPRLGLREKLQPVGLTDLGTLEAPGTGRVGWYDDGATPGQRGPAVLVGDRGSVFSQVASLPPSEWFLVTRADGSRVEFVVDRVRTVASDAFPTRKVYGPTKRPELRLVGYADDEYVIVFARAMSLESPPTHG